jgi:hypothetical protein
VSIGLIVWLLAFGQTSARDRICAALDSLGGEARARSIARVRIDGAGYATDDDRLTTFVFSETRDNRRHGLVQDVTVVKRPGVSQHSVRTLKEGDRGMDTWFTEAPENVLLAALDAPDLSNDDSAGVRFTWHARPAHMTFAPLRVKLDGATTAYTHWKNNYPRQWTVRRADAIVEAFTADRVTIETAPAAARRSRADTGSTATPAR